jgi:Subtilase family/Putative binding domain, N-terminal
MLTVGAAPWWDPGRLDLFSSRGPTPDFRIKPDIVGADNVATATSRGQPVTGTGQAAGHVAGLAALVKGAFPTFTPQKIAAYLKNYAESRGSVPNDVWGFGFARLPDPCTYALAPGNALIDAGGGALSFTVSTAADCDWTAASNTAWLTLTSSRYGTGPDTVSIHGPANAAGTRSGTLTIAGITVTVTQRGVETLPLSTPRTLTATTNGQTVSLAWLAPLAGMPTGYSVEVGSGPGLADYGAFAVGNVLSVATGAPNGTYFVRVRAESAAGAGPPSNEVVVVVGRTPGPPEALQVAVNGATVAFSWQPSSVGGPATRYVLSASLTPGGVPIGSMEVASNTLLLSNVPPGTYYARVQAVNSAGVSAPSNEEVVAVRE